MLQVLSDLEKCQILLGNFYGDGNYQRHKKYKNATYILSKHSNKQNDYVRFLEEIYKIMGIYQFSTYDKINNGGFSNQNYCSYVAAKPPDVDFFETPDFYYNGKKVITENGLNQLSEMGLLLWYLDDGSLGIYKNNKGSKRHARLSTQCYSEDEHKIIQKVFKNKWNLNVKIYGQHHQYTGKFYNYIYFNCTNFKKFFDLVRDFLPHIPHSMKYKFDMKYDDPTSPYNLL
jgi:hypothetical protein